MNPCCYLLYSEKLSRYYIGYSSDLDIRLIFHENSDFREFTYNAKDWKLYYKIACASKRQGEAVEAHIKRMKSRIYIENLLKYSEITFKLMEKYADG